MARSKANRRGAAAQKKKAIAPGKLSTVSLQDLHAEGEVWQCIMGHLVADRTALYCLGFSARFLWESVLKMPVATLQVRAMNSDRVLSRLLLRVTRALSRGLPGRHG
eukprot:COSAG05_NODE_709_length_7823_cov_2.423485_8_plen_107_part_00